MKRLSLPLLIGIALITLSISTSAQEAKRLKYTPTQIEQLFIEQNLQLIAEKMNVSISDAEISQAKLWDNPEVTISDINLWSTAQQRSEIGATGFPKNTQYSIELSQLIQTANKRAKLVNVEKVSKEIAIQEFEDLLRSLRVELRTSIHEVEYLQAYREVLINQQQSLEKIITTYEKQYALKNISRNELLRLQSGLLELESEINELESDFNEQQKNLKSLLQVPALFTIEIDSEAIDTINPNNILLTSLLNKAIEHRPDLKLQKLQTEYYSKSLLYEKSHRVPDITISANYDRYGGVWKDFIGFGVSFDIPLLNRNQGNIKVAKINMNKSEYLHMQQINIAQNEITEAFNNYTNTYNFNDKINNNALLSELDDMLNIYTKNMIEKNISMLEYIDFIEAFKNNKQTILSSKKNVQLSFNELQYTVGYEIK